MGNGRTCEDRSSGIGVCGYKAMDLPQSYLHEVTLVLAVLNFPVLIPEMIMATTTMLNLNSPAP